MPDLDSLLTTSVFNVMLVFTRIGFAFMLLPGFGAAYVTARTRLAVAMPAAILIAPVVAPVLPPQPDSATMLVLLLVSEVLIGLFLALMVNLLMAALHLGGTALGFATGLMNARAFDPTTQQSGALILAMLSMMAVVLIFIMNLHHVMIRGLVESYALFPPGVLPPLGDFVSYSAITLARSWRVGWQLAAPMIVYSIIFYVAMGIMVRLMPKWNIFFVSLPLKILTGLAMMFLMLPSIMLVFLQYLDNGLHDFFGVM